MADRDEVVKAAEEAAQAKHEADISAELEKLRGQANFSKRRATILALAEEAVRPDITRAAVFARPETISAKVYYSSDKDWGAGTSDAARLFQNVLESVIRLKVNFENGRDLRRQAAERRAWQEKMMKLADDGAGVVEVMLSWPLFEEEIEEPGDDGEMRIVRLTPSKWSLRDAATLLKAADETARRAFGPDSADEEDPDSPVIYLPDNARD